MPCRSSCASTRCRSSRRTSTNLVAAGLVRRSPAARFDQSTAERIVRPRYACSPHTSRVRTRTRKQSTHDGHAGDSGFSHQDGGRRRPQILTALVFWFVGRWLIGRVVAVIQAVMGRNAVDPTLTTYLGSMVAVILNVTLVLGILGCSGSRPRRVAALLAGAGLAIGAGLERHARQLRRRRVHARPASLHGRRLRHGRRGHRDGQGTRVVRHDGRDARQREDHHRQRQDLRRHDLQLLGVADASRRANGSAGRRGRDPLDAIARLREAVAKSPTSPRTRRRKSTSST